MAQVLAYRRKKTIKNSKIIFQKSGLSLLNGRKSFMKGYNSNDLSGKSFGVFTERLLKSGGYI